MNIHRCLWFSYLFVLYVRKKTPRFSLDQFDLPENSDAASVLFKDAKRKRFLIHLCVPCSRVRHFEKCQRASLKSFGSFTQK
jgi:hypothetical protein